MKLGAQFSKTIRLVTLKSMDIDAKIKRVTYKKVYSK
jgi:hypothetical protein